MIKKCILWFLVVCMGGIFLDVDYAGAIGSGGFETQILSGRVLGMGNVFTAQADNPVAVFYNPAGLTQLDSINLSLGVSLIATDFKYKSTAGLSQSAKKESFYLPSLFCSMKISESVSAGLGLYSSYGLSTRWGADNLFKYVTTDSEIAIFTITPCVAYKLSEKLSFGIGIDYNVADNYSAKYRLNLTALNTYLNGVVSLTPDGSAEIKGDGSGISGNISMLYKPLEKHSIGFVYRSPSKLDIKGNTKLTDLSGTTAIIFGSQYTTSTEFEVTLPPKCIIGYAWQITDPILIELDYEWTGWTVYDETKFEFAETDATRSSILNDGNPDKSSWKDTSSIGIGVQYALNQSLKLRGGWSCLETPLTQQYFNPSNSLESTEYSRLKPAKQPA